ncbi:MAG: hypothetical protein KA536_21215 [Saprospiraceae bacterium]|nr:hypothetical protein [Saprospiraceae bacterium]
MKNLKLVSLMALTALFLFLGGCQKDDDVSSSVTQTILNFKNFKYLPPELSHLQTTDNRDDKLVEVNSVFNAVLDTFQKYDPGNLKTEKFINDYGLPLWSQYKVIVADNDEITYSIPIYNSFKKKIDGQFCITKSNQKIFIKFVDKTALLSEYSNPLCD